MKFFKDLLVRGLSLPLEFRQLDLLSGRATIFMLHRFAAPDLGVRGMDPAEVRGTLEYLRRNKYSFLALRDLIACCENGEPLPERAIAFTLDDGYFDQAQVGPGLFAEFDCPVTCFVCTGFVDRDLWMWWDRIEYAFDHTRRRALWQPIGRAVFEVRWDAAEQRGCARAAFIEACKRLSPAERERTIAAMAAALEVEVPSAAPAKYAAMTWDELRAAERGGMEFGAHTVTHPVLSQLSSGRSLWEIEESWTRLQKEAAQPCPVFCYPNGMPGDYGYREMRTLETLGLRAAVTASPGYTSAAAFAESGGRFQMPRFCFPENRTDLLKCVTGIERLNDLFGRRPRSSPLL